MTIENERSHFYQWDLNQRLIADEYEAGTELHFVLRHQNIYSSLHCEGFEALVTETYAEGEHIYANIPNLLLQCSGELYVYVYLTQGEESHTAAQAVFPVTARRRPADYIYTETEVKRWEDLEARLLTLEETGVTGSAGADGYTPVRGTDYWTEADKAEIISDVLANFTNVSEVAL